MYFPYLLLAEVGLSAKISSCFGRHCGHKVLEMILNSKFVFINPDQAVLPNRFQLGPWPGGGGVLPRILDKGVPRRFVIPFLRPKAEK